MSDPEQVAGVQTGLIRQSRRFSAFGLLRIQETEQLNSHAFECFGSRVIRVTFDEAIRRIQRFDVAALAAVHVDERQKRFVHIRAKLERPVQHGFRPRVIRGLV